MGSIENGDHIYVEIAYKLLSNVSLSTNKKNKNTKMKHSLLRSLATFMQIVDDGLNCIECREFKEIVLCGKMQFCLCSRWFVCHDGKMKIDLPTQRHISCVE